MLLLRENQSILHIHPVSPCFLFFRVTKRVIREKTREGVTWDLIALVFKRSDNLLVYLSCPR